MIINNDSIKNFSFTGRDSKVPKSLIIYITIFIVIHGVMIALSKESVPFSILITLPFLLLFLSVYFYANKKSKQITDGYNFLVLSVGGFCLSITDLVASLALCYEKTNNLKLLLVLLFIYILSSVVFYLSLFCRMNKFEVKKRSKSVAGPASGIAGLTSVVTSAISLKIMNNIDQLRLSMFFSLALLIFSVIWLFPTCLMIKFVYLRKNGII